MPRHLLRRHPTAPPTEAASDSPPHPQQARSQRQRLYHDPARFQFQTPPSQGSSIPQLHPSSGPIDPNADGAGAPEPVRRAAAAQAALFNLFGRGVVGRPARGSMGNAEDEEEEDSGFEHEIDEEDEGGELDAEIGGVGGLDAEGNEVELSEGEDIEGIDEDEGEDGEGDVDVEDEDEDEMMHDRDRSPTPLPSDLREISSLASWTVSTHKPGCGVAALRNTDHTQYWQSDGPQPHTLTLHFFKLVAVVKIRVYLDFSLDESYTPTKMTFMAGMGGNDLVEFATWEGDNPCGWVDVPLDGIGGQNGGWVRKRHRRRRARKSVRPQGKRDKGKGKYSGAIFADDSLVFGTEDQRDSLGFVSRVYDEDNELDDDDDYDVDDDDDPYAGNVLKAMVIQMRVIENHQNGKDTHVRGFQVFARDDDRRRIGNAPSASADGRTRRHSVRKSIRGPADDDGRESNGENIRGKVTALEEPDWMGDPVIR
ncbi:galactose-binding domain-like protein [Aspergillus pseudoustus]|uniref:Galactose-binding domain-like protein n=1 Tax=Aspergillus pseudoustus TaxID=1810923 RepID=A0ABR4IKQ7_9EURO